MSPGVSVTLGLCPGLADRCPHHKTNSSSTHGAPAGSPLGWPWHWIWHETSTQYHHHPDNEVNERNSAHGGHSVPRGQGWALRRQFEPTGEVGAGLVEAIWPAAVICTHVPPESRSPADKGHLPLPLTVIPLPAPQPKAGGTEPAASRRPGARPDQPLEWEGPASQGFPSFHLGSHQPPRPPPSQLPPWESLCPEHPLHTGQQCLGGRARYRASSSFIQGSLSKP